MKKCVAVLAFLSCVGSAYAADHWQSQTQFGFSNYILKNPQQHKLILACNRNAGEQYDHGVSFILNQFEYHNTERQSPITLVIDQNIRITPPATTRWRQDAQTWNRLKNVIAKAQQIDVLLDYVLVSRFRPSEDSIHMVATEIQGCDANS